MQGLKKKLSKEERDDTILTLNLPAQSYVFLKKKKTQDHNAVDSGMSGITGESEVTSTFY